MANDRPKASSITSTRNYRLFKFSDENRPLNLARHKRLRESMQAYGFLRSFPAVCVRSDNKELVVKDGQHRIAFAEELGLPVHYIVESVDFDVAKINCTPKSWTPRDYAEKYAKEGVGEYQEGLLFADRHQLPIGLAFAILADTNTFGNISRAFEEGRFAIKNRVLAEQIAAAYVNIIELDPAMKNVRFLQACIAACRVEGFSVGRLIEGAKHCRDKLVAYSTREAYLELMEEIYNFRRREKVPVKFAALQAMRDRTFKGKGK